MKVGFLILFLKIVTITFGQGNQFINAYTAEFNLYLARDAAGKYGYINFEKEMKIPFKYDFVTTFSKQGFATVSSEGKFGIIDTLGTIVIPITYEGAYSSDEQPLFIVNQKGLYGVLGKKKEQVLPFVYTYIGVRISDNLTFTAVKNDKWGVVNHKNEILVPFEYSCIIFDYSEKKGSGTAYTDNKGTTFLSNGMFLDKQYSRVQELKEGYKRVISKKKEGVFNKVNELVLPCEYEGVNQLEDNPDYFIVEKDGLAGLYHIPSGKLIIPIRYAYISETRGNLLSVTFENEQEAFFDLKGNQLFGKTFDGILSPDYWVKSDKLLAAVKKNGKWGLIDIEGKMIVPFEILAREDQPDLSFQWDEKRLKVEKEGGYGIMDVDGKIIIPFEFYDPDGPQMCQTCDPFNDWKNLKYYTVKSSITYEQGIMDINGNWIIRFPAGTSIESDITYEKTLNKHFVVVKSQGISKIIEIETKKEYMPLPARKNNVVGLFVWTSYEHKPLQVSVDDYTAEEMGGIYIPKDEKLFLSKHHKYIEYNSWENVLTGFIMDEKKSKPFSPGGTYALIDYNGRNITDFNFDEMQYDREGRLFYVTKGNKVGFIDRNGKEVIPITYDTALITRPYSESSGGDAYSKLESGFRNGYVSLRKGNRRVLINRSGQKLIDNKDIGEPYVTELYFEAVGTFYAPMSNTTTYTMVPGGHPKYSINRRMLYKNMIYDAIGGNLSFTGITKIGEGEYKKDAATFFCWTDGMLCLRRNGKFGYLDYNGKEAIPFAYDEASEFKQGLAVVRKDDEYFVINKLGERMPMKHAVSMVFNIRK